jgi:LPS-assembly protein
MPRLTGKRVAGPPVWRLWDGVPAGFTLERRLADRRLPPALKLVCCSLLALLGSVALPAMAQTQDEAKPLAIPAGIIDFEADSLTYDEKANIVNATGNVIATRDGYRLQADEVTYNRASGQVEARGNVVLTSPDGKTVTTDRLEVSENLKDGIIDNIRLILEDGSRIAASSATKNGNITSLNRAVYSPCDVCNDEGEEQPLWQIKAVKVVRDENKKRIYYRNAYLEFLNQPILYLPYLSQPDPTVNRATGFLVPQIKTRQELGIVLEAPYFINLAPWRDLTITPTLFSGELPALSAEYRERFRAGPVRFGGTVTYAGGRIINGIASTKNEFRGYVYADSRLQHNDRWRSTFKLRLASDDTFLRRYDISYDDTLRNSYSLERFTTNSYFSGEIQAFQGLRSSTRQGLTPIILPSLNYWWRSQPGWLGGRFTAEANTTSIVRTDGLDLQRGTATAGYEIPYLTSSGQQWKATVQTRADLYHVSNADRPDDPTYGGLNGTRGRILPLAALEVRWPLGAPGFGGQQTLEPVVQIVAARRDNAVSRIPNEDSRSIDLDEANLFSLNRFPGYDRFEGGARLTYGARWSLNTKKLAIETQFGQSYRLNTDSTAFPTGTGLSGKFSDFVGRTSVRIGDKIDIVHRFRIDKQSLAIRRNEIDAIFGGVTWTTSIGYSRLNRNIGIEDLADREELRLAGRLKVAKYWSITGSTIIDLTSQGKVPPGIKADGFSFVRNKLGFEYEDECFLFGLSWRRNYTQDRDFRRGSTYILQFALKTLGGT